MPLPAATDTTQPGVLLTLLVTLLTPLFLTATAGDLNLARIAAAETMNDFHAQTSADLLAIAQIIAFGLTALVSLSQSVDPVIPLPLALRLRGNANNCSRAAEQHRRAQAVKQIHPQPSPEPHTPLPPAPDPAELIAKISETQQRTADHLASFTAPKPTPTPNQKHVQAAWAAGAARIAAETAAEIATLPPEERENAAIWADILNECAKDMMNSDPAPRLRPSDSPAFGL